MSRNHQPPEEAATDVAGRRMPADRVLAVGMILLQLVVLGYLSGAAAFPLTAGAIALWGFWSSFRLRMKATPLHLVYAVLAVGFLLHYMFAPYPLPVDSAFIHSALAHSLARMLICVQLLQMFLHHDGGRMPLWFAALAAVTLTFSTNLRVSRPVHFHLLWLIAVFLVAFALYGGCVRRAVTMRPTSNSLRRWLLASALMVIVTLGTGASWTLQKHERSIDWFISEYMGHGRLQIQPGFTPSGRLDATTRWKGHGGEQIMLRIFADQEPGYLRGKAFDTYRGSTRDTFYTPWQSRSPGYPMTPSRPDRSFPRMRETDLLYKVAAGIGEADRVLDVWPSEGPEPRLFMPLGTRYVAVRSAGPYKDGHGVITLPERFASTPYFQAMPYMVFATPIGGSASDTLSCDRSEVDAARLTALDAPIDEAVRKLATDLFAGCRSTRDKIDAVQRYFHSNYSYRLGINVPQEMDAITYFLTQRPAAHCEYFATGTAVLLRLANVPCRYVVGYVSRERNATGGFYVARNKDAHAWVEAYDAQSGQWVIVESTPSAGVPQPRKPPWQRQLTEMIQHRMNIWRMSLRDYGFSAFWSRLAEVGWSIPGLIILLGVVADLLLKIRPRFRVRGITRRKPSHLRKMHRALMQLDRQAKRHGLERAPEETLDRFARRVVISTADAAWKQRAADFYLLYAQLRYRGDLGPQSLQKLQVVMPPYPRQPIFSRWARS